MPNFIDPERWTPESPRLACRLVPAGRKVLLHVSNFRPVKRVLDVVEIFDRLRQRVPATLVMIGDGPDRPAAEALCREKGIAPYVSFLGNMPALEAVMPAADLYLLPSDSESFGLSALEAQACGVPVLGYAVGGLPEVVAARRDGLPARRGRRRGPRGRRSLPGSGSAAVRSDGARFAGTRHPALRRGRDRLALRRAVRARPRRGLTGDGRAAAELGPGRSPRGGAPELPDERRPEEPGVVRRERHGHARAKHA